jgi:phosphoglycerate dehydrogenase-like enzyme
LPHADFVVSVLPNTPDNVNFFDKDKFNLMKQDSVFMNIGRGCCVDESELINALQTKKISGAVLDVYANEPLSRESELWNLQNVLMTPHCADGGMEYLPTTFDIFKKNVRHYLNDEPLTNLCDKKIGY